MIKGKKILGIIPARCGSKELQNKNILALAGKPLIFWTIDACIGSEYIDRFIVSTDCEEIADIALKYGADVPFLRPSELATDEADSNEVVLHAIEFLKEKYDLVVLLQPTSPLRTSYFIDKGLNLMFEKNAPAVVSVVKSEHPYELLTRIGDDLKISWLYKKSPRSKQRRQEYLPVYRINGAIYIAQINYFLQKKTFITEETIASIMPTNKSIDIDNEFDLRFAEFIINYNK